jgi:hypothetical protein
MIPNVMYVNLQSEGSVTHSAEPFLSDIDEAFAIAKNPSSRARSIIDLPAFFGPKLSSKWLVLVSWLIAVV